MEDLTQIGMLPCRQSVRNALLAYLGERAVDEATLTFREYLVLLEWWRHGFVPATDQMTMPGRIIAWSLVDAGRATLEVTGGRELGNPTTPFTYRLEFRRAVLEDTNEEIEYAHAIAVG